MSESVLRTNSGAAVASNDVEMGSGEPRSPADTDGQVSVATVNGVVSVAVVQNANVPKLERQTAEHVQLEDDDSTKCCCSLQ